MSLDEILALIDKMPPQVDAEAYARLSGIRVETEEIAELNALDPFGDDYRRVSIALHRRISGLVQYDPSVDENSNFGDITDVWRMASPFSFGTTQFVAEFLASWAAIFQALDVKKGQSVLEYGSGSGQALLMLARTGIEAYGADIDEASLDLIRQQAKAMGLSIPLEKAVFGEGFAGNRFDRILFFEAFHHAEQFDRLLTTLHDRLVDDGRIVLCGEPIVERDASIPYAWGPRMDALSILCMRRYGWMELGFQRDFFVETAMRAGWKVSIQHAAVFRATTYILEKLGTEVAVGAPALALPPGWSQGEGAHRWTVSEHAFIPLPKATGPRAVKVTLANYLSEPKTVVLECGGGEVTTRLKSGELRSVLLPSAPGTRLFIRAELSGLDDKPRSVLGAYRFVSQFFRNKREKRRLGVAVQCVRLMDGEVLH